MIKRVLLIIYLLNLINLTKAAVDTTIFDSEFEKKVFTAYMQSGKANPVDLLMAINYDNRDIKNVLDNLYSKLDSKSIGTLKDKKKIKLIFDLVHDDFLRKYNDERFFIDIFKSGEYNCVSASALYSIILNHYNIDFVIKETPTHVYLLADPKNTSYLIETTLPEKGVFYFDDKFKKSYIEYLRDNKIISDNEFKTKSLSELFNENYNNDETIDITSLAGLQYYNKGIFAFNSEDYISALKNFEKAEILYSSDKIRFLKSSTIANILNKELLTKDYSGKLLAKYINCNTQSSVTIKFCEDYFDNVSNELVINHPEIDKYDIYFNEMVQFVIDSANLKNIYQSYYTFKGYYEYSNYNYNKALLEFEKAYYLNSTNIRTKQLISEVVLKYFAYENDYYSGLDSLNRYFQKFPFLLNDQVLQKYLVYCYAQAIGTSFQNDNSKKGHDYLEKFEKTITDTKGIKVDGEYAGYLYGNVASYYFRKQDFNNAEKYILRGLELSPNSIELNQRLNSLKESSMYLNGYTGKFSSKEKINKAISRAKANKTITNENVSKFLIGRWELESITVGDQTEKPDENTSIVMNLLKSKSLILSMGKEHQTGEWSYDENNCKVKLKESKSNQILNLIIFEINEKQIVGGFYANDNESGFMEVIFKSIK